ncbi:hypothetical protein [Actinomadura oligospora]|uniref:hypothetical protein n=1 Tax=Actinomadura oligospora TaxID=111804 RepID=UPI00047EDF8F|nr:hypothetical protein [Actinomadura oligospora]
MTVQEQHETATVAPRARLVLFLLVGRVVLRLLLYAAGMILVFAWGRDEFSRYAAAAGTAVWLTPLVQAGPEKAALKLLPRATRTRGDLLGPLRATVALLPLPFAAATAVMLLYDPHATATLYIAAASYQVSLGCTLLGTAVHRALGRADRDVAAYAALSVGLAVMCGLVLLAGPPPVAYFCGLLVLTLTLNLALARLMPVPEPSPRVRKTRALLAGTVALMGAPEVTANLATSLLYVELSLTALGHHSAGHDTAGHRASGDLYLVLMAWSLAIGAGYFAQRVFQPATSVRLTGRGAAAGRSRAHRLARGVLLGSLAWPPLALAAQFTVLSGLPTLAVLAVLMVSRAPLYMLMTYASYLLENSGGRHLRTSAMAGATGLLAVVVAGAVAIPLLGAAGAVYALAAKELVLSLVVLARAARRPAGRSASGTGPARRPSEAGG